MCCKKINLLGMDREKLLVFFDDIGAKSFCVDQVMQWIYHHYCDDFDQMTNLSKPLRVKLKKIAEIQAPIISCELVSIDGTIKWSMKTDNNQYIETVYIPDKTRSTLCISSQIGCALNCSFCGTGRQGFNRNLYASEIVGQVWRIKKKFELNRKYNSRNIIPITNVVFMGMGEPLLNLTNVVSAIKIMLNNKIGFGLSKRRIVVSTSGIVPAINKLKNMVGGVSLAVSLHAPNDKIRNKIMPINRKYNIRSLLNSVVNYMKNNKFGNNRVTIEYVLLNNINDNVIHAHQLANLLINIPCKINLIPWNPISNSRYSCSTQIRIDKFFKILLQYRILTIIRKNRGVDISAACGQLTGLVVNRLSLLSSTSCNIN